MSPEELTAVGLSLMIALASTLISLIPAIAVAWLLARRNFPGKTLIDGLVHVPLVMPPVVIGYLLLIVFGLRGPLGRLLDQWFGVRLVFTTEGAIIAAAVMSFPLFVRAIRLGLEAVDRGLEVAARTLGATPADVFRSVTLPLMLPGILSGAIVAFAAALGEFGATITFVSNVEGATRTLPLAIFTALSTPDGDAVAARLVAISFALSLGALILAEIADRTLRRRLGRA